MSTIYFSETLLPEGAPAIDLPDNDWKGIFFSGYNPIVEGPLQRLQDGKAADNFAYAQWTPVGDPESNDDVLKRYYQFLGLFLETYHGETPVRMTILGGKTHHASVATFSTAFPYARYELFRDVVEHLNSEQDQDSADDGEMDCDLRVEFPGSLLQRLSNGKILAEALDVLTWTTNDPEKLDDRSKTVMTEEVQEGREDAVQDESQDVEADALDKMEVDEPEQLRNSLPVRRNEAKKLTTDLTVHVIEKKVDEHGANEHTTTDKYDGKQIYDDGVNHEAAPMMEVDALSAPRPRSPKKRGWAGWVKTDQGMAPPVGSGVARVNIDNIIEGGRSRKRRF
ncbi:hypothetical protein KC367_g5113 [Hortaea werneckii]|nr:hypothetical protein KC342_g2624 [Hortaea werneckii]KAI7104262.1 hypothetical protein KC339_g4663 [Hortaea werneckii]KAI7323860.1 hypothetical protein KC340_g6587 [Hortaea werneckii]KAI7403523.1 hypothetical protein KC328_g2313 [Hortaea werneckii]KAI7489434.1 hypothetical protein KC351_g1313 [Hortaea werneckii]